MIDGDLQPADLPAAWNESYRRDLGIVPPNDSEGCLQDGHWAAGLFGYFPTYTIGNLFAAQLMARVRQELGDLDEPFAHGDFGGLLDWLRQHIYRHGSRLSAAELVEEVSGAKAGVGALVDSLRKRYGEAYGVE
jgi:carboxypeptidase Taq